MTRATDFLNAAGTVQADIATFNGLIGEISDVTSDVLAALRVPGDLEDALDDGADAITLPSSLVTALRFVPGVGATISSIDTVTKSVASFLRTQADAAGAIDSSLSPALSAVSGLSGTTSAIAVTAGIAGVANATVLQEAAVLSQSLGRQEVVDGFELAERMDGYIALTEDITATTGAVNGALLAVRAAIQDVADLFPDVSDITSALNAMTDVLDPFIDAANDLEDLLCTSISIPFVGTFSVCDVLAAVDDFLGIIVDAVVFFVEGIVSAFGFNFDSFLDGLRDELLAPLDPIFDAIDDLEAAVDEIVDDLLVALDPLEELLSDLLSDLTDVSSIFSLFENTIQGDLTGPANDLLGGTAAEDAIYGLAGNDRIEASGGGDFLFGGAGADVLIGSGGDEFYGGGGFDRLQGSDQADRMDGGGGLDRLFGGGGDDLMVGGNGLDLINGAAGNDEIYGGNGNDRINGGAGADLIFADNGNDQVTGGAGADTFVFTGGNDVILDFTDDVDSIIVSTSLVPAGFTVEDFLSFGTVVDGDAVFVASTGISLTIRGLSDIGLLADDVLIL